MSSRDHEGTTSRARVERFTGQRPTIRLRTRLWAHAVHVSVLRAAPPDRQDRRCQPRRWS